MSDKWIAAVMGTLMCIASFGVMLAKPSVKVSEIAPVFSLEAIIPKQFGDWSEEPQRFSQVVNPQTKELLDKLYSQILSRTYVNAEGYRVMLSLAYGSDQRGSLQAHKPEVCYPAQGFTLLKTEASPVLTPLGAIPAQRLFTSMGARQEPVTYWFTVGENVVQSRFQKRIVELSYGLTGRIPDGLIFRISSLDGDQSRANLMHDRFVNQLLQAVPVSARVRLSGLGGRGGS